MQARAAAVLMDGHFFGDELRAMQHVCVWMRATCSPCRLWGCTNRHAVLFFCLCLCGVFLFFLCVFLTCGQQNPFVCVTGLARLYLFRLFLPPSTASTHATHGHKQGGGPHYRCGFFEPHPSVGSIDPQTSETALPSLPESTGKDSVSSKFIWSVTTEV